MRLFNTLSGKKEDFSTPDGKVRMYVCGITPYGRSHIGHAMFSIIFDVVRRYLEFKGYEVKHVQNFTAVIQVLDIPGEIKKGYSPIGFVRTGRAACRIIGLNWKMGKETGGKKAEEPHALKTNEMAEVKFEPCQPLVVDSFKNCEGTKKDLF